MTGTSSGRHPTPFFREPCAFGRMPAPHPSATMTRMSVKQQMVAFRQRPSRVLKKTLFAGCSKMPRCKAPEILRSEAYMRVRRNDEG